MPLIDDDSDLEFSDDPEALAEAAEALAEAGEPPTLDNPLDGPVTLPGGTRRLREGSRLEFEDVTKAWVKELNGKAEEEISKARLHQDDQEVVNAILRHGVVRLGDRPPTQADLDGLLIGDRDFLLLEISRSTYGNDLEYEDFVCYHCNKPLSFIVHKDEDIPVTRFENQTESEFEVTLKRDRVARVMLPTGEDQANVFDAESSGQANTALIAACVQEITGSEGVIRLAGTEQAVDHARALSVVDRQKLVKEMADRMPGPRYNEVRFKHEGTDGCGGMVELVVTLAELFRGL